MKTTTDRVLKLEYNTAFITPIYQNQKTNIHQP